MIVSCSFPGPAACATCFLRGYRRLTFYDLEAALVPTRLTGMAFYHKSGQSAKVLSDPTLLAPLSVKGVEGRPHT